MGKYSISTHQLQLSRIYKFPTFEQSSKYWLWHICLEPHQMQDCCDSLGTESILTGSRDSAGRA
jgi:hypothetical protein